MPRDPSAPRVYLKRVDAQILSSYKNRPLHTLVMGQAPPSVCRALSALDAACTEAGFRLQVTDLYRPPWTQAEARKKWLQWVQDGKPRPHDEAVHKPAFVAKPGRSFHGAGRAIDINLESLAFRDVAPHRQLARFWEVALPLGWRPVIPEPDSRAAEAWHFDHMGPWLPVYERLGYEQAAIGATIDMGGENLYANGHVRFMQAHLQRAGYDVGDIDGIMGPMTAAGLREALPDVDVRTPTLAIRERLMALPSQVLIG